MAGSKSGKLYFGIVKKPSGTRYASATSSLQHKQVRRYGKKAVPRKIMKAYGGSKTSRKTTGSKTSKKKTPSSYNKFVGKKMKEGKTMKQAASAWRAKK